MAIQCFLLLFEFTCRINFNIRVILKFILLFYFTSYFTTTKKTLIIRIKPTLRFCVSVVVDTNRWYHKTNVLPGDISITIGAEYD